MSLPTPAIPPSPTNGGPALAQPQELADVFATSSILITALKGAHLAQAVYPKLTLRAMQDIDLLV